MTFLQGLEIIFRVGLAILQYNQTDLIQLDMEGMSQVSRCWFATLAAELSFMYTFNQHRLHAPLYLSHASFLNFISEWQICFDFKKKLVGHIDSKQKQNPGHD